MYSFDTEFLTPTGWRTHDKILDDDLVGREGANGAIEFVSKVEAGIKFFDFKVPLYECQIGRSGKFCIASDLSIRLFKKPKRKDELKVEYVDIRELVDMIQRHHCIEGFIAGTNEKKLFNLNPGKVTLFSGLIRRAGYLSDEGVISFPISRALSQRAAVDYLLGKGIKPEELRISGDGKRLDLAGFSFEMLFEGVLSRPENVAKAVDILLTDGNERKRNCIRVARFYCKSLADLAQLSMFRTGKNSKVVYDELKTGRNWAVIVEPSKHSIRFRNKIVILSHDQKSVTVKSKRMITRYDGRISVL